jgi:hypothetical protein
MNNENFGLSRRNDEAWKLEQMKQNDPDGYDALIEADLEVMKQPIFEVFEGNRNEEAENYNPRTNPLCVRYSDVGDIITDYPIAHSQLLANLSGDDTNPHDIWALASGDYTALERLPEDKRDVAFRICDRMEESGNWKPTLPGFDPNHSYKISRLNDGQLGVSQQGQVFHTEANYDGISNWLGENDPTWEVEGTNPAGMTGQQFYSHLGPWDEIDDNCIQEEIWEQGLLSDARETQRELNREEFLAEYNENAILVNPFENSDDDDETGFAIVKFPDF